jgi:hypothetical protein
MVHCCNERDNSFVTKICGEVFTHILMQSPQNVTVVCRIDCLAYQDEYFVNKPLRVRNNYKHALHFALHLSHLFYLSESGLSLSNAYLWLMLTFLNTCLIFAKVSVAHRSRLAQNLMHTCCWIHCEIASGQIHDSK